MRQEVVLDVRVWHAGPAVDEAAGFEMIRRAEAVLEQQPAQADPQFPKRLDRWVQADGFRALPMCPCSGKGPLSSRPEHYRVF
jgi:hypothetical protein